MHAHLRDPKNAKFYSPFSYEPRHEKTCICHMRTTKAQISLCIRCLDSIIPLVSISEISSLYLASVAEQASLCLTWSQTPKTGFLVTGLIWVGSYWYLSRFSESRTVAIICIAAGGTVFVCLLVSVFFLVMRVRYLSYRDVRSFVLLLHTVRTICS